MGKMLDQALHTRCFSFGSPLSRRWNGGQIPAREHVCEQNQQLFVNTAVGAEYFAAVDTISMTCEVRHPAARFFYQQDASGRVPGVEVELPKAFEAPGRHIGKVEGS